MSSATALNILKKKLKLQKAGFLGTLDPAASGVLVILVGTYTKRADEFHRAFKIYETVAKFGVETDTLDAEGKVIATSDKIPTREEILAVLPQMVGEIEIEVPKFSAVHINGARAYDLARKGIDFVAPKRVVRVEKFTMIADNKFEIICETGTYIRSLVKLLAQKLGTVAIAQQIIRTRVGEFDIKDSKTLETVTVNDIIL
jgi:tRNA pseudouridine55 synthase